MKDKKNITLPLALLALLYSFFAAGCDSGSSTLSSWKQTFNTGGTISGNVTASGTISTNILAIRPELRANFNIASAAIWIQEHPEIRTQTAADGSFILQNVPYGSNRVVAKIESKNKQVFKTRSNPVSVTEEEPATEVGELSVQFAGKKARIVLRDADGNPVPFATLSLWGETFEANADGTYLTPPLPDSEVLEEILINAAAGFLADTIVVPFVEDDEAVIVSTLKKSIDKNFAPNVWLTTVKVAGDKINPGEIVKIWAVYTDKDSEDLDRISLAWAWTGGSLASGSTPIPEDLKRRIPNLDWNSARVESVEWTAPSIPGNYKVSVDVTDPEGLSGKALHPLNVHLTDETPLPEPLPNQAPTGVIIANTTVIAGDLLPLQIIASDSELDLLSYEWSVSPNAGTLSSIQASKITWQAPQATGAYQIQCKITEIRENPLSTVVVKTIYVQENPIIVTPGKIAGHVLDSLTRQPIPQAVVAISGTNIYKIADDLGYFEFVNVQPGTYTLIATRNGYQSRTYPGIVVPAQ
ncbi:MAG: CarboxypepD reg-like domain [Clostridiales bacterium]|nr:CarboxypepD reg-like domain [Clostridiales bacterium]MDN5282325.1 CarboxypepD reg-like domain [Candidatus Ozemobacter sp.]